MRIEKDETHITKSRREQGDREVYEAWVARQEEARKENVGGRDVGGETRRKRMVKRRWGNDRRVEEEEERNFIFVNLELANFQANSEEGGGSLGAAWDGEEGMRRRKRL